METYKNVMEILVEEEVERQYQFLPPRQAAYLKQTELVAYALNQLPALYATSQKGLKHQLEKGRAKHGAEVARAVQRAIAAVGRDPLRVSLPLQNQPSMPLREVLQQLRLLLHNDKIDWDTLPIAVEQALTQAHRDWRREAAAMAQPKAHLSQPLSQPLPQPQPLAASPYPSPYLKQYMGRSYDRPRTQPPATGSSEESFDWDNPLYDTH